METPPKPTALDATDEARQALGNLYVLTTLMNPDGEDMGTTERSSLAELLYRELGALERSFKVLTEAVEEKQRPA